jgi:CBS domain-containing protein
MTVAWILKDKGRNVFSVLPNTPINETIAVLAKHRIGAVVVADEQYRVLGIISERDIVRMLAKQGPSALDDAVADHMTKPVVTCTAHHSIDWLMSEMTTNRFRHIPVTDQGRLAGIVSIGDVVKFKLAMAESEAQQMRQYFVAG